MTNHTGATSAALGALAKYSEALQKVPKAAAVGQPTAARGKVLSGASLGNTAKTCAARINTGFAALPENVQWTSPKQDTGEITPFIVTPNRKGEAVATVQKTPQKIRAERFMMKAAAGDILPNSRTAKCLKWRRKDSSVQILQSKEHGKAFYSGLQQCGSVWTCPVCAAKISERRRVELQEAILKAKKLGLRVLLLTLTMKHGLGDDVGQITDQMLKAWRRVNSGTRAGKALHAAIGFKGSVRAIEVTHGDANGFHPHIHALIFLDGNVSPAFVQQGYSALWQQACQKLGLPMPSDQHGCKVDDGSKAAAYASKWGLESEMTKGHTKTAGLKGMSPWDFLRAWVIDKDEHCRNLFKVYAEAFQGRRQLYWSNGLRKLFSMVELSDEELINQQIEPATVLAEITVEQWRAIYKSKSESAVLDVAENNPDALQKLLDSFDFGKKMGGVKFVPFLGIEPKPTARSDRTAARTTGERD